MWQQLKLRRELRLAVACVLPQVLDRAARSLARGGDRGSRDRQVTVALVVEREGSRAVAQLPSPDTRVLGDDRTGLWGDILINCKLVVGF